MINDYVAYIDTDSCYIKVGQWISDMGIKDKFYSLTQEQQMNYVKRITDVITAHVNDKSYHVTQRQHYNSQVDDFKIVFEPEKIALTGLFSTKKRYATWTLLNDGKWKDDMSITGLEVIRSDSPEQIKPKILEILKMVLRKYPDEEIRDAISKHKSELYTATPEEISTNKGINKLSKYLDTPYTWIKKCPHQLKGVANFAFLLNKFGLEDKYDIPQEGNKAKIVYLKPNKFNKISLSFYKWPKEFDKLGIQVDYVKMVHDNYVVKVENLLKIIDKLDLMEYKNLIDRLF